MHKTLLIFLVLFISFSVLAKDQFSIKKITYSQGLSENTVSCIAQDSLGYIWIGTREGLNRYDGYSCKSYFASRSAGTNLSSGKIERIFIDSHSKIWIKTDRGLDCYLQETDSFEKVNIPFSNGTAQLVNDIYEQAGIKWLATAKNGLIGINAETDTIVFPSKNNTSYRSICPKNDSLFWAVNYNSLELFNSKTKSFQKKDTLPFNSEIISTVYYNGLMWLATSNGIWIYDEKKRAFISVKDYAKTFEKSDPALLPFLDNILITDINVLNGKFWASTDGNGILVIDTNNGFKCNRIHYSPEETSLSTNAIRCLFPDRENNMWIGTVHNGVNLIAAKQKKFSNLKHTTALQNFPSGNFSNFIEDNKNQLWAATFDGLCLIDQGLMSIDKYVAKGAIINCITIDWDGDIFMGTYNRGLLKFNPEENKVSEFNIPHFDSRSRSFTALLTDHAGDIWIGTNSLYRYNKKEKTISEIEKDRFYSITCLLEDRNENIWVGTFYGLKVILKNSNKIEEYNVTKEKPFNLSSNTINCLFEDKKGNIWVATDGGGLNRISKGNQEVILYENTSGLTSNVIHGIAEDNTGNIWLTTNSGIVRLNPESGDMAVFDYSDGLINNQYIDESLFLSQSGRMLCGGEKGIDYFYPEDIQDNTVPPKVIVNGYFVDNKPVVAGNEQGIYQRRIYTNDTLTFKYNQSYFSFQFTGIEYANPQKIQYAYQLEGFNNNWTYVQNRRFVNYGHIPSGKYTFKVKAANSDGYWTAEPTLINVVVKPPFAKTPTAYFLYLLGVGFILYISYRYLLERKLLQNKLEHESKERKRIEELNQFKLRVFTHISHEFRTPISLIISPAQELLKRFSKPDKNYNELELIHNNAKKLQFLVNEVLEVRKIESGTIKITKTKIDIVSFSKNCFDAFYHWANKKNIKLSFSSDFDSHILEFDQGLIEKVIYNLLSNAIKFTPNQGNVKLELGVQNNFCVIKIIDSGIGISKSNQKKLFEMFYQVNKENTTSEVGSGIGLSLCKELVELHNGKITVESEPEKGSCFSVLLPLPEQKIQAEELMVEAEYIATEEQNQKNKKEASILLVDDNEELRKFLAEKLSEYFNVTEAQNGAIALQKAKDIQPQLVISDVMMPEIDGWQLCAKIKSDIQISHIPVVLLTALNDTENTIKGLDLGADAYLSKPFNLDHVISLINNILSNRKKLMQQFGKNFITNVDHKGLTKIDKAFLNKIQATIEENISTTDFSVQILSDKMAMSRVNLHLKLKALCDLAPSEFIMQVRLNEALKLLKTKEHRISEIADMTGFSTASHFSRNFKKNFGGSPSEFIDGKITIG